jgi:hypothetical protein
VQMARAGIFRGEAESEMLIDGLSGDPTNQELTGDSAMVPYRTTHHELSRPAGKTPRSCRSVGAGLYRCNRRRHVDGSRRQLEFARQSGRKPNRPRLLFCHKRWPLLDDL